LCDGGAARPAKSAAALRRGLRKPQGRGHAPFVPRSGTNVQRGEAALLPQTAAGGLRRACPRPPISAEVAERAESALSLSSAALVGVRYKSGREKAAVSNFHCPPPLGKRFFPLDHPCGGLSCLAKPNFRGFLSPRLLPHLAKRRVFRTCAYAREARTRGRRRGCRRAAHPLAGFARFVQRNCFAIPPRRACAPLSEAFAKKSASRKSPKGG